MPTRLSSFGYRRDLSRITSTMMKAKIPNRHPQINQISPNLPRLLAAMAVAKAKNAHRNIKKINVSTRGNPLSQNDAAILGCVAPFVMAVSVP